MPASGTSASFTSQVNATTNDSLDELLNKSENRRCADCNDVRPTWAVLVKPPSAAPPQSPTLGLFCCLHCSAAHRKLGNISCTVKSVKLDQWDHQEILAMLQGGNLRTNAVFEGSLFDDTIKPTPLSDEIERERFIHNKYTLLRYFVQRAYICVGSEGEDEDENVFDKAKKNSLVSHNTSSIHIVPEVPVGVPVTTADKNRVSINKMMHRQSSLPIMKFSVSDPYLKPRSSKVSDVLALKKIASPFQAEKDHWESMKNSTWGSMTFEDSLHRKSSIDLQHLDRRSSWGLAGDDSIPPLCFDSEKSESKMKLLRKQHENRGRGMPKKAVSERLISTSLKDLSERSATPKSSMRNNEKAAVCLSRLPRPKSARNLDTESHGIKKSEKRGHTSKNGKHADVCHNPSSRSKAKVLSVLDMLEEENEGRKRRELPGTTTDRNLFRHLKAKSSQAPRHHSEPAYNLRQPPMSWTKSPRINAKRIDHAGDVQTEAESSSISPTSSQKNGRNGIESISKDGRSDENDETSTARPLGSTIECESWRMQGDGIGSIDLTESSSDGSSKCCNPANSSKSRKQRRHASMSFIEKPSPPTLDTPMSMPCRRKTLKDHTQKGSMGESMREPNSARTCARLERSLSHQALLGRSYKGNKATDDNILSGKNRNLSKVGPRSPDTSRRNRLKQAKAVEIIRTGNSAETFQHPLFAYPITMNQ
ncbi:putative GTPase activating protein [Nitzschia inconspicua]|uniref:GTPase activating protein n=1 Tax=Nitzschia inconspicua TaxID=303405 RepID=A0A9K3KGC3_9STRA|nr:putative GTPase activating protein [Nitzschia inconspicua]